MCAARRGASSAGSAHQPGVPQRATRLSKVRLQRIFFSSHESELLRHTV
jgi:hypothetical protein